jgi:hypothetical protein
MLALRSTLCLLVLATIASAAPKRKNAWTLDHVPLDRFLHGEVLEMRGRKVRIRYDFENPAQAKDFYYNRPFQREGRGSFDVVGGILRGVGGGGFSMTVAFEPDIVSSAKIRLDRPVRDAGLYFRNHRGGLRATLYALKETYFSRKDSQALGINRIIEIGSVPSPMPGGTEFRYVAASNDPEVVEEVVYEVRTENAGKKNIMTIGDNEFSGADVGIPLSDLEPGLFTNGGRAYFDEFVVEGKISEGWLTSNRVAMFLEKDIENPANRLKTTDKKALTLMKSFLAGKAPAAEMLEGIANPRMIIFVRERLARAVTESERVAEAIDGLENLLLSDDLATRILASRILVEAIDIDFGYGPRGDEDERKAAVARFTDYAKNRAEREARGQAFLGGAWRTPEEVAKLRLTWEFAREIRTDHFLLRTNLPEARAADTARLLEAGYDAFRQFVGREPGTEELPLTIFLFAKNKDFKAWCEANGQERWASYNRLIANDLGIGLTSWQFQGREGVLNVAARLYYRATFNTVMPLWYEEGFANYFSWTGVFTWIRGKLETGKPPGRNDLLFLKGAAAGEEWIPVETLVGMGPRDLRDAATRRLFYLESWALMTFLTDSEEFNSRWSEFVGRALGSNLEVGTRRVLGLQLFLESFEGKMKTLEAAFKEWIGKL